MKKPNLSSFKPQFKTLALVASAFAFAGVSHAAENEGGLALGVVGAATIQNPTVKDNGNSTKVDGKTAFGGGATLEMGLRQGVGIEADVLYLNHKFSQNNVAGVKFTTSSGYLQVPVLVRYRPIPYVNLGAGAYYSRVVSSWSVSGAGSANGQTNYGKNDFGAVVAIGTNVPVSNGLTVVADLRYARSLTDNARDSTDALKFADFQALAGVRFGF